MIKELQAVVKAQKIQVDFPEDGQALLWGVIENYATFIQKHDINFIGRLEYSYSDLQTLRYSWLTKDKYDKEVPITRCEIAREILFLLERWKENDDVKYLDEWKEINRFFFVDTIDVSTIKNAREAVKKRLLELKFPKRSWFSKLFRRN